MSDDIGAAAVTMGSQESPDETYGALRYWLATEHIYTSPYVREWLKRTPGEEATDVLTKIASHAAPDPRSLLRMMFNMYLIVFSSSEVVRDNTPASRKAGKRAAMLLAGLGDARCLPPLVRVFEPHWFWTGSYQNEVEVSLLQFLSGPAADPDMSAYSNDLRQLANKIWKSGGRSDLSDRLANLLIADLECLQKSADQAGIALVRSISEFRAKTPNRASVKSAAQTLLGVCEINGTS